MRFKRKVDMMWICKWEREISDAGGAGGAGAGAGNDDNSGGGGGDDKEANMNRLQIHFFFDFYLDTCNFTLLFRNLTDHVALLPLPAEILPFLLFSFSHNLFFLYLHKSFYYQQPPHFLSSFFNS